MTIYVINSPAPNAALGDHIKATYPSANFVFSSSSWFVSDDNKTTQEVCEKLNIKKGGFENAVVLKIDGYFGVASPSLWEWIKVKNA